MKMIDPTQAQQIVDLIAEEDLSIDAYALEKDFHVGAVLSAISKINDPVFDLIFCGGTCLSKAYGILERLSEDVDIKVILKPGHNLKGDKLRRALSGLKQKVVDALIAEGFDKEQFEETEVVKGITKKVAIDALDGNTFINFKVRYGSRFQQADGMRSRLQLELNHTNLALPSNKLPAESLFDRLRAANPVSSVQMSCVNLTEAAVEKLISFPRRLAMHMRHVAAAPDNTAKRRAFDKTLVRHIYDIHEINRMAPATFQNLAVISDLMKGAMEKDAKDFNNQHPEFAVAPVDELKWALSEANANPEIEAAYLRFLGVMVYGEQKPDFKTAMSVFEQRLQEACAPHLLLSFEHLTQKMEKAASKGLTPGM